MSIETALLSLQDLQNDLANSGQDISSARLALRKANYHAVQYTSYLASALALLEGAEAGHITTATQIDLVAAQLSETPPE